MIRKGKSERVSKHQKAGFSTKFDDLAEPANTNLSNLKLTAFLVLYSATQALTDKVPRNLLVE